MYMCIIMKHFCMQLVSYLGQSLDMENLYFSISNKVILHQQTTQHCLGPLKDIVYKWVFFVFCISIAVTNLFLSCLRVFFSFNMFSLFTFFACQLCSNQIHGRVLPTLKFYHLWETCYGNLQPNLFKACSPPPPFD